MARIAGVNIPTNKRVLIALTYIHGIGRAKAQEITSSLGISRWKDMNQINASGERAASRYDDLMYWTYNWRKHGGSARMIEISKREEFYQQEYCGCVYSLRDTNRHRRSQGRDRIALGVKFYGRDELKALKDE